LAPAAVAAAIALAGCSPDGISPSGRALAPLSDQMLALIEEKHMDMTSPILLRIFKEESQLEVWKQNLDGQYALLKTYPICRWSGALGPKKKEGDRQAPEGFYTITRGQMNPNSNYYLAFNTGYPNAFDRAWDRTGSELMVHGDCSSRGCYAMTNEQIQEIYALAREAFFGGQQEFQLQAYPFRMTALNMAKHRNNPNFAFWKQIKQGYDSFEATRQQPKVAVCEKRYVFDAAVPEGETRPLRFNPRGTCPTYRLDPVVADAILDHRRQEQIKMAEYIADGVEVQPIARGADGGMHPVFADSGKLTNGQIDENGRVYTVASLSSTSEPAPQTAGTPTKTANVPLPERSPLAKPAPKQQSTIAGLIDGLFSGGSPVDAAPAAIEPAPATTQTELAAKPKKPTRKRTASTPVRLRSSVTANDKPQAVARTVPKPEPAPKRQPVEQAAKKQALPQPKTAAAQPEAKPALQSAYSTPATTNGNGMLTGAQPVVRSGSFDSRWSALR
jgi:murein L,D-transpeptidase YafK